MRLRRAGKNFINLPAGKNFLYYLQAGKNFILSLPLGQEQYILARVVYHPGENGNSRPRGHHPGENSILARVVYFRENAILLVYFYVKSNRTPFLWQFHEKTRI